MKMHKMYYSISMLYFDMLEELPQRILEPSENFILRKKSFLPMLALVCREADLKTRIGKGLLEMELEKVGRDLWIRDGGSDCYEKEEEGRKVDWIKLSVLIPVKHFIDRWEL